MIAMVDPVLCNSEWNMHTVYFMILLIASSRKTCNSQSLESCNQNPTYVTCTPIVFVRFHVNLYVNVHVQPTYS